MTVEDVVQLDLCLRVGEIELLENGVVLVNIVGCLGFNIKLISIYFV